MEGPRGLIASKIYMCIMEETMRQHYFDQDGFTQGKEPHNILRKERQMHSWTQEQVSEKIGADPGEVSRWERGRVKPGNYYQERLCDLYGKTPEQLGFTQGREEKGHVMISRRDLVLYIGGSAIAGGMTRPIIETIESVLTRVLPPPNNTSRSWPIIEFNIHNVGNDLRLVRVAQWMQKAHIYDIGTTGVDGSFGHHTLDAVVAFQENKQIKADGIIDGKTWELLILPSHKDQHGSQVAALHERLYNRTISSSFVSEADAMFSEQTENAVRAFQYKYQPRLVVNGEADLDTWCKLLGGDLL
jgi:peptidoglycan hydrolase-like protein with peptidoglycan-binding domain/DNA-binding XRE family transcriptional regulator